LGTICDWKQGYARKEWQVDSKFFTAPDLGVFGGYLSALADQMMVLTAITVLEDGQIVRTTSLQIDYFRPVTSGSLIIEGRVINLSRRLVFVEISFLNEGELAAKARGSLFIVNRQDIDRRWKSAAD